MTSELFLGFVTMMATVVIALIARYLNRRAAIRVLAGYPCGSFMPCWDISALSKTRRRVLLESPSSSFPPFSFSSFFIVRSSASAQAAVAFPIWIILCTQCFRIGVELFLHQLSMDGRVPQMLIFEGANVGFYRQRP
jgi:hypothetical protein